MGLTMSYGFGVVAGFVPDPNNARIRNILERMALEYPRMTARAMDAEMRIEMQESMKRTPVRTGALRDSHRLIPAEITMTEISCGIVAGENLSYAVIIHEDLDMYHPHGQAKFLESTLKESAPHLAKRLAKRMQLNKVINP